ncbi:UBC-like protein, partial [Pyrenochaeta sp. DS3sAY3a]
EPFNAMDTYVNEVDMGFWKVIMEGPSGTPYAKGTFVLSVSIGQNFPQTPPAVRFLTPILHPNITKHGRVCHQVFTRGWRSSYHVHTVLQYMHDLLRNPEVSTSL